MLHAEYDLMTSHDISQDPSRPEFKPPDDFFADADVVDVTAGDVLYHPAGIWHHVECTGEPWSQESSAGSERDSNDQIILLYYKLYYVSKPKCIFQLNLFFNIFQLSMESEIDHDYCCLLYPHCCIDYCLP